MTTAAFGNESRIRQRTEERQELVLLASVALIIIATGYVLDAPIAGVATASAFLIGSVLTQVRRLNFGIRQASFVGVAHLVAVVAIALSSAA